MKRIVMIIVIVLALCGPSQAEVYQGNINGFSVELEVKEIIPGLGVMVVWSDGERVGNVGWYQEPETGMMYGQWGVVFAVDPGELTLFWPVWAVFRSEIYVEP